MTGQVLSQNERSLSMIEEIETRVNKLRKLEQAMTHKSALSRIIQDLSVARVRIERSTNARQEVLTQTSTSK